MWWGLGAACGGFVGQYASGFRCNCPAGQLAECLPLYHWLQPRECSYSLAELREQLLQLLEEEGAGQGAASLP